MPILRSIPLLVLFVLLGASAFAAGLDLDERAACLGAIEQVYWSHRSWPAENPGPKPPLSSVVSAEDLHRLAEEVVRKGVALERLWHRPVTAADLQTEIDRMVRQTRRPEVLHELFGALDHDSSRIAECLARPLLVDRLLRSRYAWDSELHENVRARARNDRADWTRPEEMSRTIAGSYREVELSPGEVEAWFDGVEALSPGAITPVREDEERLFAAAVLRSDAERVTVALVEWPKQPFDTWWRNVESGFAAEIAPSGGTAYHLPAIAEVVTCTDDSWDPLPLHPPALAGHEAVWTGAEMIVWGGTFGEFTVFGRYDPALDTWRPISNEGQPPPRTDHTAVWTGTEMIVWGGWGFSSSDNVLASGGRYSPATDSWTPTISAGAPQARTEHTAVWTGSEMVVWGGCTAFGCSTMLATGGRYDPDTNSWVPTSTAGVPAGRARHTAVWTGAEMIVWGGCEGLFCGDEVATGGRYNPNTDVWAATSTVEAPEARSLHTAVWSGSVMIVWGGCPAGAGCSFPPGTGGRYDPATDTWAATSDTLAPEGRRYHVAAWAPTTETMVVWGGCVDSECSSHRSAGGQYDPVTDVWTPTSTENDPTARSRATAVWTGSEVIVWGGCSSGECQVDLPSGGRYDPASDTWVPTAEPNDPGARINHTAIWTGAEMIVWGGFQQGAGLVLTGRRYDPATDAWSSMAFTGSVGARDGHSAVWTGSEMIVWGGRLAGIGTTVTGGRYNPASDTWAATNTTGAAEARASHTAVWTGSEMIVWGGCAFDDCASFRNSGGRYDPVADEWAPTSVAGAPSPRFLHRAVWTGTEMIVWGGASAGFTPLGDGARYDPVGNSWTGVATAGAPSARYSHTGVWTGSEMIVWGGTDDATVLDEGARYDPGANAWSAVAAAGAPSARRDHSAVWTGAQMIVWGGCNTADCSGFTPDSVTRTGGRYEPGSNLWSATSTLRAPASRNIHTAVWTGSQMIVWGGWRGTGALVFHSGARYCANAVIVPVPDVAAAPNPLGFGPVEAGDIAEGTITVSNQGNGSLTIASLDAPGAPFAITTDGCTGQTLGIGGDCAVVVSFAPVGSGTWSDDVTVHSDDPDEPALAVGVSGTGVEIVLTATGLAILDAGADGVIQPGEAAEIRPSWFNGSGLSAVDVTGSLVADSGAVLSDGSAGYGTIPSGEERACSGAAGCYALTPSGPRPGVHWDIAATETVSTGDSRPWSLHVGDSFSDVVSTNPLSRFVETVLHHGVTAGCSVGEFCPSAPTTRAQMAVFLLKAGLGSAYQPPACSGVFADVPCPGAAADWIEDLRARGITAGCATDPLRFCPNDGVTRSQMAVFLLRSAEGPTYSPPSCNGLFDDVSCASGFAPFIEELSRRAITAGCSAEPALYCPDAVTTRGQMSVFLTRTFGLQLYAP